MEEQQRQTAFFTKTCPFGIIFASGAKNGLNRSLRHGLQFFNALLKRQAWF
jgi:hypothetical protein